MNDKPPSRWKKTIVISAAFGIAFAVTSALILSFYFWYQSRPKPPIPWNKDAVVGTYDRVDTEGDDNTLVFYYTLENKTEFDYTIERHPGLIILAKLQEQGSLSGTKRDDKWLSLDYPLFIPSGQRLRFAVHLKYPFDQKEKRDATKEGRTKYRKALETYINKEIFNLAGFVLFDEQRHFQIDLPKGW